jgi:hypothetical protein
VASGEKTVPEWEEYPHTPGVFVRVANKGLARYGTWKSVRKMGDGGEQWVRGGHHPSVFFVSVASEGFSRDVSLLFATLAGGSISVASKGLRAIVGRGQWSVVSGEKKRGLGIGGNGDWKTAVGTLEGLQVCRFRKANDLTMRERGGAARMLSENHAKG